MDGTTTLPSQRYQKLSEFLDVPGNHLGDRCDSGTIQHLVNSLLIDLKDYEKHMASYITRHEEFVADEVITNKIILEHWNHIQRAIQAQRAYCQRREIYIADVKNTLGGPARTVATVGDVASVTVHRLQGKSILGADCQVFRFDVNTSTDVLAATGKFKQGSQYYLVNELVGLWGLNPTAEYYLKGYQDAFKMLQLRLRIYADTESEIVKINDKPLPNLFSFNGTSGDVYVQKEKLRQTIERVGPRFVPMACLPKFMGNSVHGSTSNRGRDQHAIFTPAFNLPTRDDITARLQWLFTETPLDSSVKVDEWILQLDQTSLPGVAGSSMPTTARGAAAPKQTGKRNAKGTKKKKKTKGWGDSDDDNGGEASAMELDASSDDDDGAGPSIRGIENQRSQRVRKSNTRYRDSVYSDSDGMD